MSNAKDGELLGKTSGATLLQGARVDAQLTLEPTAVHTLQRLAATKLAGAGARVYLCLENIQGTHDATVLNISLRLPDAAASAPGLSSRAFPVGGIGLYGLRRASVGAEASPARGLQHLLDVSAFVEQVGADLLLRTAALVVSIEVHRALAAGSSISIGQIRLFVAP